MDADTYITERVEQQINWYDKKSRSAQSHFKLLRGFEIAFAALIPLIAGFGGSFVPIPVVVGAMGACVGVAATLISLNQYQENWIKYRTNCEALQQQKFLFLTRTEPYDSRESFALFVQNVESLISKENNDWSQMVKQNNKKSAAKTQPELEEEY